MRSSPVSHSLILNIITPEANSRGIMGLEKLDSFPNSLDKTLEIKQQANFSS
ncbi:MAG: hypothetical protein ACYS91_11965 [Planctomycetota bacterium]